MKTRTATFSLLAIGMALFSLSGVVAQTQQEAPPNPPQPVEPQAKTPPAPTPAPTQLPAMPPDRKAYTDAMRITDPEKKIEALEKFVADFSDSFMIGQVNQTILSTLVKTWPDQQDRILAQANKTVLTTQDPLKGSTYSAVAGILIDAGILLDKAEEFSKEGLTWVEEDQAKRTKLLRAPFLANLGRVNLKRNKTKEAEKLFKEALAANPQLVDPLLGLAEIAEKKNDEKQALEHYASAFLSGRVKLEAREKFYTLYRKSHNGSLNGLDELLDTRYRKDYPNPVSVEHYKASAGRPERTVLAEIFTGSGCPPCVAADLAFDAYLERYSRKEVAVLMYHLHIPQPDPMTNPSTLTRSKFYAVTGVPSYVLDGEKSSGGGSRDMTKDFYNRVKPNIEKRLNIAPQARIQLDASPEGQLVKVKATADEVRSKSSKVNLQIVLVEDMLRYTGENGVRFHPMVVRSLAGPKAAGFVVNPATPTSVEWTFDLNAITAELKTHLDDFEERRKEDKFAFSQKKHEIDPGNLSVVAFVQDEESKAILQAVSLKLKPSIASVGK